MRRAILLILLTACGGGEGGGDQWDGVVDEFVDAICVNACVPVDSQAECQVDVQADMDQARAEIGPGGEDACIQCMQTKSDLIAEVVAAGCQSTPALDAEVAAACDVDPTNDDDGDGDPENDTEEACAGFP